MKKPCFFLEGRKYAWQKRQQKRWVWGRKATSVIYGVVEKELERLVGVRELSEKKSEVRKGGVVMSYELSEIKRAFSRILEADKAMRMYIFQGLEAEKSELKDLEKEYRKEFYAFLKKRQIIVENIGQ